MKRAYWIEEGKSIPADSTTATHLSRKKVEEIMRSFPEGVDIRVYGWKEQVDQICELACPVNTDDKPACQSDLAECERQEPIEEIELREFGLSRVFFDIRDKLNELIRRVNERTT